MFVGSPKSNEQTTNANADNEGQVVDHISDFDSDYDMEAIFDGTVGVKVLVAA